MSNATFTVLVAERTYRPGVRDRLIDTGITLTEARRHFDRYARDGWPVWIESDPDRRVVAEANC